MNAPAGARPRRHAGSPYRAAAIVAVALFVAVVLLHAGLIPLGFWGDEYRTRLQFDAYGIGALVARAALWSPRPVSETLLFVYLKLSAATGQQLIVPALALLWTLLLCSLVALPVAIARRYPGALPPGAPLLGAALLCCMLLNHPVGDFFYSPQSTVAYIPTAAAAFTAMWLLLARGLPAVRWTWLAGVLTLGALSSEAGAFFAIAVGLAWSLVHLARGVASGRDGEPPPRARWLRVPLVAAAYVLVSLALGGRFSDRNEVMGDPEVAHRVSASFVRALGELPADLFPMSLFGSDARAVVLALVVKGCLALAAFLVFARGASMHALQRRPTAVFVLACGAAVFAALWASWFQFGMTCCQRHGSLRQGLLLAAAVAAGAMCAPVAGRVSRLSPAVPVLLCVAAVGTMLVAASDGLRREYASRDAGIAAQAGNWQAGRSTGPSLLFLTMAPGPVVGALQLPHGTFHAGDRLPPGPLVSILDFFDKQEITVRDAADRPAQPLTQLPGNAQLLEQAPARCSIDAVNGRPASGARVQPLHGSVLLEGWAAPPEDAFSGRMQTWIVLSAAGGGALHYAAMQRPRDDVAVHLKDPKLKESGFRAWIDTTRLPPGEHGLRVVSLGSAGAHVCSRALVLHQR